MKRERFGILEISVLLFMTSVLSLSSGLYISNKLFIREESFVYDELKEIVENYEYIKDNYYGEINKDKLISGAIKGMVESLDDDHTSFLDSNENGNFKKELEGSFQGVGIEVINKDESIVVMKILNNSPASKSGLKIGDIFLKINNIDLTKKSANEFAQLIGLQDDKFSVLIKREDKELKIDLYKDLIVLETVFSKTFEVEKKTIGYLKIDLFAYNTYGQLKGQLEELEKLKIDGLIIDVRNNLGGHLSVVENIASLFLDTSHIIYQIKDKIGIEKVYSKGSVTKEYPIVLLGNKMSASASELLIGALIDEYGAEFVGVTTYGKGTVQELSSISTSDQYKITTKEWLTPRGVMINKKGLVPNLVIEQDVEYYLTLIDDDDRQLQEALKLFFKS